MPGNSAWVVKRKERDAAAIALRKDKGLSFRAIAAELGCTHETARKAVNKHLARLDQACLEGASALRGELYEKYDAVLQRLEVEVLEHGELDRVPELLKTSQAIRQLYALDVQPLGRTELHMRRAAITELAGKLKDRLAPELFAEVIAAITDDDSIPLVNGVALAGESEAGIEPPQRWREGPGAESGPGPEADDWGCGEAGSGDPLPVVVGPA